MHEWTHNPILCDLSEKAENVREGKKGREKKEIEGEEEREKKETQRGGGGFPVDPGRHVVL